MIDLMILSAAAAAMTPEELTLAGPEGPIAGTLVAPAQTEAAIVFIAGSGPTDRNGDSPLGVKGSIYRQLADALAEHGIATLLYDKRGLFASAGAIADPEAVTFDDYAADALDWAAMLRTRGLECVWIAGHSEGSTVAQVAAAEREGICGLILISGAGRPIIDVMQDQFAKQLPPAMLEPVKAAIAQMKAGEPIDVSTIPAPLQPLFKPGLIKFMSANYTIDPADLLPNIDLPVLIVQGAEDLQVAVAEAERMQAAKPDATLLVLDGVNHALKNVPAGDTAANVASYGDGEMKIDPRIAAGIADFVKAH